MEIQFRAKRKDNGKWIQGFYVQTVKATYVVIPHTVPVPFGEAATIEVDPVTVGQYTGLMDKNGNQIFEGDVISYNNSREVVQFNTELRIPCFTTGIGRGSSTAPHPYKISKRHAVIGNIHDNPELLK